jgi:hypothetical protein
VKHLHAFRRGRSGRVGVNAEEKTGSMTVGEVSARAQAKSTVLTPGEQDFKPAIEELLLQQQRHRQVKVFLSQLKGLNADGAGIRAAVAWVNTYSHLISPKGIRTFSLHYPPGVKHRRQDCRAVAWILWCGDRVAEPLR